MAMLSCLMTTRDRPHFVAQALRCFARQTHRDAELVLVDAGEQTTVEDLCAGVENVRYVRAEPGLNYGASLNRAASEARYDVLQLLDDDDYYDPRFLARAAQTWDEWHPVDTIAAWDCFHVLVAGQEHTRYSGHGWSAGATLSFQRALWERVPFRAEGRAQDYFFKQDTMARIAQVCAPELYLLIRHGANSWNTFGETGVDDYFRSLPPTRYTIDDLVHADDRAFYSSMR